MGLPRRGNPVLMTVVTRPLNTKSQFLSAGVHAGENGFAGTTMEKRAYYGNIPFLRADLFSLYQLC